MVDKEWLELLTAEIKKLSRAKVKFSVQELQSMNLLDESADEENKRILQEIENFLNSATNMREVEKLYNKKGKKFTRF